MQKYQTVINFEEQHLANMSTSASTSVATTKTTRTMAKKSQSHIVEENLSIDSTNSILDGIGECVADKNNTPHKPSKKKSSAAVSSTTTTTKGTVVEKIEQQAQIQEDKKKANGKGQRSLQSKKNKKGDTDQENMSVKSSFSKFDALQKRNLIHNAQSNKEIKCHLCTKPVYKMEEVKAEKNIYHKNCFRCHECNKQLKVDNYQSHEGILYCMVHFKLLFSPKCVEDTEPESPRKPELIVRENEPIELPPDVVRASDKSDLGLEELQQLNVRSRFQVFENATQSQQDRSHDGLQRNPVKHSASILSKIANLKAQGISSDLSIKASGERRERDRASNYSSDNISDASDINSNSNEDDDAYLVRSKKQTQREHSMGLGRAMHDIKTKFEKGHLMSKEERREERKQEIQNIRSRLFLGKQARIKEMYQQAVAESEQGIHASANKPKIEVEGAARSLKERFERGDVFKDSGDRSEENSRNHSGLRSEADVFESAISKQSRSIFMELDANTAAGKNYMETPIMPNRQLCKEDSYNTKRQNSENELEQDVVKYDEKPDDIKVETSEISSKFKFFESYLPSEQKKKVFRITPPLEGVVKMPTPESDTKNIKDSYALTLETKILEKSHTTTTMLNKFREMEQNLIGDQTGPRPLKCFTPPPDSGKRVYRDADSSDMSSQDENEEFEDEEGNEDYDLSSGQCKCSLDDEALKEAQTAARAKQLRAKFEKWEANERAKESNEGRVDIYSIEISDNSNIESTKTIRERFENMKDSTQNMQTRPRHQVNRFV